MDLIEDHEYLFESHKLSKNSTIFFCYFMAKTTCPNNLADTMFYILAKQYALTTLRYSGIACLF